MPESSLAARLRFSLSLLDIVTADAPFSRKPLATAFPSPFDDAVTRTLYPFASNPSCYILELI